MRSSLPISKDNLSAIIGIVQPFNPFWEFAVRAAKSVGTSVVVCLRQRRLSQKCLQAPTDESQGPIEA
jgi:hypothetical protein